MCVKYSSGSCGNCIPVTEGLQKKGGVCAVPTTPPPAGPAPQGPASPTQVKVKRGPHAGILVDIPEGWEVVDSGITYDGYRIWLQETSEWVTVQQGENYFHDNVEWWPVVIRPSPEAYQRFLDQTLKAKEALGTLGPALPKCSLTEVEVVQMTHKIGVDGGRYPKYNHISSGTQLGRVQAEHADDIRKCIDVAFLGLLNELRLIEPTKLQELIEQRVIVGEQVANHAHLTVSVIPDPHEAANTCYGLGLLGVLNGIYTRLTGDIIQAEYDDHESLTGFKEVRNA